MKKWIALSLALIILLSLCACKKGGEEPSPQPTDTAPTKPTPPPSDPPENPAPEPNFYLLKEISSSILGQEVYFDMNIQLNYNGDYHLTGTDHYENGHLSTAVTYRSNTLDLLGKLVYSHDGQIVETYVHEYDEKGNPLTITGTDANGTVIYSKIYNYDPNGLVGSCETYHNGQLSYWESYHYDEYGLRDSFSSGDGNGNLLYDLRYRNVLEDGKLKAIITLNNGEYYHTVSYNDNGDPITEVRYASGYKELSKIQYTYTESGKPLAESHTNADKKEIYRVEYVYDELDQLIEVRRIRSGQLEQKALYTYDNGLLTGYKSYTYDQLDADYTYIYEPVFLSEEQAAILSAIYAELMN